MAHVSSGVAVECQRLSQLCLANVPADSGGEVHAHCMWVLEVLTVSIAWRGLQGTC